MRIMKGIATSCFNATSAVAVVGKVVLKWLHGVRYRISRGASDE